MTMAKRMTKVDRLVDIFRCNRCAAESLSDAVNGWMHLCVLELRPAMPPMGLMSAMWAPPQEAQLTLAQRKDSEQHLCSTCAALVLSITTQQPAPQMVGNDLANIPIRTEGGAVLMLTRFEYDRWVAEGKPPVLGGGAGKS